jgi:aminopeptidase I
MVKNNPNSLRGSASTQSLRIPNRIPDPSLRIADLEAQIAALKVQAEENSRRLPGSEGLAYRDYNGQQRTRYISPFEADQPETSLFQKYDESMGMPQSSSLITRGLAGPGTDNTLKVPEAYTQPFCDFLTENPTVFHAVDYFERKLGKAGFTKVSQSPSLLQQSMGLILCPPAFRT